MEERDLLLARLLECKTFKDAAGVLLEALSTGRRIPLRIQRDRGPRRERFIGLVAPDLLEGVDGRRHPAHGDAVGRLTPKPEPVHRPPFHVAPRVKP